tara:strand:- start:479 stop:685 length:207 start_codon:yes stop_codon:yes gene_type:complete
MKMPKGIRIVIDGVEEKDASILVKLLQDKLARWRGEYVLGSESRKKDTLRVLISAAEGKLAELIGDER